VKNVWTRLKRLVPTDPRVRIHFVVMLVVLTAAFATRVRHVYESLPYCRHPDESTWANIAIRMLKDGDMNPRRFRKPSLPVYIMYAGFGAGLADARLHGEAKSAKDLGSRVTPYYEVPRAAVPPKLLFALASVVAMGLGGYIAFLLTRRALAMWLVPLLTSLSSDYYRLSWSYMNVDIIGAVFVLATVAYLVHASVGAGSTPNGGSGMRRAVVAGVLAGLAVGSKYNLFPVLLPGAFFFLMYERKRVVARTLVLGAASVLTFFATSPYILLSFRGALDDILKEARHYATGHPGATVEPGLAMLGAYARHFAENFGVVPLALSVVGVAILVRRDARLAFVAFAHPVVFVIYMCSQRVFFERNVVGVHVFIAIGIAVALLELSELLSSALARRWPFLRARGPIIGAVLVIVAFVASVPWSRSAYAYGSGIERRNDAARWVNRHVDKKTVVLVDSRVDMDRRTFAKKVRVQEISLPADNEKVEALRNKDKRVVAILRPGQRQQYSHLLGRTREVARFDAPQENPGGIEVRPLVIVERR
jgi:hypothetical protein